MAKTILQLKAQGAEIKNATVVGENTATRVGTLFNDIVEHVEDYEAKQAQRDTKQDNDTASLVTAERERAISEEDKINKALASETARAKAAEEANAAAIEAEAEARTLAISQEAQARAKVDDELISVTNTHSLKIKGEIEIPVVTGIWQSNGNFNDSTDYKSTMQFLEKGDEYVFVEQINRVAFYDSEFNFLGVASNLSQIAVEYKYFRITYSSSVVVDDKVHIKIKNSLETITSGITIIGDSISTFTGYIPSNFLSHYPNESSDVDSVEKTYWKKIANQFELSVNNLSYSGSTVSNNNHSLYSRAIKAEKTLFYLIALGTNDSNRKIELGEYQYDKTIEGLDESLFIPAYIKGIKAIKKINPDAKIILVSMNMDDAYAYAIKNIAEHYGDMYCDVRNTYTTSDGIHPDSNGMDKIASKIIEYLLDPYYSFNIKKDIDVSSEINDLSFRIMESEIQLMEGILSAAGGINKESEYKSSVNYFKKGVILTVTPVRVAIYDENKTFINVLTWKQFNEYADEYSFYRATFNTDDVLDGVKACYPDNNKTAIDTIKKDIREGVSPELNWEQGAIVFGKEGNSLVRIRTTFISQASKGEIHTNDTNYTFNVVKYDNYGNYIDGTSWIRKYEFNEITRFRLVVQNSNKEITPSENDKITISINDTGVNYDIAQIQDSIYTLGSLIWKHSSLNSNGHEVYRSDRIVCEYIYAVKGSVISCNDGYEFNIFYYNDNLSFWKESGFRGYETTILKDSWIRILLRHNDVDMSVEDAENIEARIITLKSNLITTMLTKELTDSIKNSSKNGNVLAYIFKSSPVVSDWKNELMTADSVFDITNDGWVYMAYFANPNDVGESYKNPNIFLKVIRFHLCNLYNIETIGTFYSNSDVLGFSNGNRPPYDPNILIKNGKVYVYTVLYSVDEEIYYWCILPFNISSGEFENHIKCSLNGIVFNSTNAKKIFEDKGEILTSELTYPIISGKIVRYNNEFWTTCAYDAPEISNFGGAILKSSDGISWEIVSISPHGSVVNGVYEMSMDITDNKAYCTMRGYGGTGIFYTMYDITSGLWKDVTQFDYRGISKAWIECYNNKVLAFFNLAARFSFNGLERQIMRIVEIDKDYLKYNTVADINTDEGCSYPYIKNHNSSLYISFQSDKRHISTGASRSNICFASIGEMLR